MPQYFQEGNVPLESDAPTQSLQKINALELDNSNVVQFGKNILGTTSAGNGAAFVPFPNFPCKQISPVNLSGTDIDIRREGDDVWLTMVSGMFWTFRGITNANQISLRRSDQSTNQISLVAEAEG